MPRFLSRYMPPQGAPQHFLNPVWATFLASLLLSLFAQSQSLLNRDGMQYITTADVFLNSGFQAAKAAFSWPFLSISIAVTAKLTGLGLENAAHLLNALFMAGACALMVACIHRRQPELGWLACLTVLALPGFNEYRNEVLREFGCWFFIMLALWLALRWHDKPRWHTALGIQASLLLASLFRPEALTLFAALIGWQCSCSTGGERWRRVAMIGAVPIAGAILLLGAYFGGILGNGRLAGELGRISTARFDAKAQLLAGGLIDFAKDNARAILLFGSIALIPIKLIQKFGILLIPLAYLAICRQSRAVAVIYPLFAWGIAIHTLVLIVFVIDLQFLAGRYVGPILLFSTPFVCAGLSLLTQRFIRWKWLVIAGLLLLAAANVINTGPSKRYFVDAGHWLQASPVPSARIYIDSGRTAFYAGRPNLMVAPRNNRESIANAAVGAQYDLFVLERSRKDDPIDNWLTERGLSIEERFGNPGRDEVIIALSRQESRK